MTEHGGPTVLASDHVDALGSAESALAAGGIVGIPTETVYGLAVLPLPGPLQAVVAAKQRAPDKGIALLVDGLDQVDGLVFVSPAAQRLAAAFWPGPLTLVLPLQQHDRAPDLLTGGRSTLGVRVPDHPIPRTLARRLGPLAVTSANETGQPEARTIEELLESVGASLALAIDDGPVRGGVVSTVVAVHEGSDIEILRDGALPRAQVEAVARGDR